MAVISSSAINKNAKTVKVFGINISLNTSLGNTSAANKGVNPKVDTSNIVDRVTEKVNQVIGINTVKEIAKKDVRKNVTTTDKKGGGGGGGSGSGGGSGGGGSGGGGGGGTTTTVPAQIYSDDGTFPITPQAFYIFNKSKNETYMVDGVIKVSYAMTLKVEEEPNEEKAWQYINNAKNEPNKVTFDVIMSEVYTTRNDLTKHAENRSESALTVLNNVKRERVLVDVVTNLMTYSNMLLSGISLTQDDGTTHFGFYGQLTFTEKPEGGGGDGGGAPSAEATGRKSSTSNARTPSVWVSWLGANAI